MKKMDCLDARISKAEKRILDAKAEYEEATQNLKDLLEEKKSLQAEQLLQAMDKSGKSFEEIMHLIKL
jgi:formiminotetrahydrofolate cyclodeaminase